MVLRLLVPEEKSYLSMRAVLNPWEVGREEEEEDRLRAMEKGGRERGRERGREGVGNGERKVEHER